MRQFTDERSPVTTHHGRSYMHRSDHVEAALRPAVIIGLVGIAVIHFIDLFDKLKETPYLGISYVGLIAACLVASWMLLRSDARPGWLVATLVSAATLAGYVASRTVGLPASTGDIGNWLEPLGLAALFVEGVVVLMASYALVSGARHRGKRSGASEPTRGGYRSS